MKPLIQSLVAIHLLVFPSSAATFTIGEHNLTVPEGFLVEKVAGPGLIDRPIEMDFDERGRLYVTESSGSNANVQEQLKEKPHRVLRLEDSDGDGVFDRSIVFADKMMFPEGAMWHDGSLYVSAPPVIWKLTDTDDDGVADKREEWIDAKTLTGCANDLHGPYLGPDGWIYWCKGAFAEQTWGQADAPVFKTRASHIFRRHPSGGPVEAVMTGGMDNPVGLAFTPEGERIFSATFLRHPAGGLRDGLVHALYGGVYGKDHDVLNGHARTGDLLPILTELGPAAPAGLARYDSAVFGETYRDNLFAALFNLHKVTRHILVPKGASYKTEDSDFLVSDNPDFHPTDVLEDADGSLLVIDTGGWYKLCCPTSQLYKPDILGGIYRVRRADAPKVNDPRGRQIKWTELASEELAALLGDVRPAVARQATDELARRGGESVEALAAVVRSSGNVGARRAAIWALSRIDGESAREAARLALKDADPSVAHSAVHAISIRRDEKAAPTLIKLLQNSEPRVSRAAAEALGRIGAAEAVEPLLQAAAQLQHVYHRALEHSIIYALVQINHPAATRKGLRFETIMARKAALVALDQMERSDLQPDDVTPYLKNSDIEPTARWLISRHPEWGGKLIEYFDKEINRITLAADYMRELEQLIAPFASQPEVQEFLADAVRLSNGPRKARFIALRAMAASRVEAVPPAWRKVLTEVLQEKDSIRFVALETAENLFKSSPPPEVREAMLAIARDENIPAPDRLRAVSAMASGPLDDDLFEFVAESWAKNPRLAAQIISKADFSHSHSQLARLCERIESAGPLEIGQLLVTFEGVSSPAVATSLIKSLKEARSLKSLHPDQIKQILAQFPETLAREGQELIATLNQDSAEHAKKIDSLLQELPAGDVRRGQALFNSAKAACSTCHAIGYLGGTIGPDLTRIGQIRTERDLLESIVFPSASFVRSYEPTVVIVITGDAISGILRAETSDEIVLADSTGAHNHIPRDNVKEIRPGTVSLMPQGLDEQLSRQELADLLSFLKSTKW